MAKFKVEWVEEKVTSTGKKKLDITLVSEEGENIDGVTIWEGFPNFSAIKAGDELEGDLVSKQNGQYLNKTLYAPKPVNSSPGSKSGFTGGTKMMEQKAKNIEEAQKRKSESIAYFNSVNSAIALVGKDGSDINTVKNNIIYWRDWFLAEYDKWNEQPPF